jgi:hypothetical protein
MTQQYATSPVTGILNEEDVIIDYGKHAGKSIREIQLIDPEFYELLMEQKGSGVYAIKREAMMDGHKTFRLYLNPLAHLDQ